MKIEIFAVIIIGSFFTQTIAKCPSNPEVLLPCKCKNNDIHCGGNAYYNLRNIFVSLSSALKAEEKHFAWFHFNNTAINELVINVFYDITFETINIDSAYNLTKINTHAFTMTNSYLTSYYISHIPYGNVSVENNIFNSINDMINIEYVNIDNTSLTSIPTNAFTALNKLYGLEIINNPKLVSLGDYAFYDLNNLTQLTLTGNPIDSFPEHALSFRNRNPETLLLFFTEMPKLNSNSFSVGMFATIKRAFVLYLRNDPQIRYLPENVFNAVLSSGNRIDLYDAPLICDCKMFWLYANRSVYQSLVDNAICADDHKSVFAERQTFKACTAT